MLILTSLYTRRIVSVALMLGVLIYGFAAVLPSPSDAVGQESPPPCLNFGCTAKAEYARVMNGVSNTGESTKAGNTSACWDEYTGEAVPCTKDGGWWNNEQQCYASLMQNPPPKSDDVWGGHTEGAIYNCTGGFGGLFLGADTLLYWSPTSPGGPAAPADPVGLAERAVDSFKFVQADIHTAPSKGPTLVNLETWLWVPESQWRTLTASASAGPTTVTVTAEPTQVEWDLGEDTQACAGPGRAWHEGLGPEDTTCYYTYAQTSEDEPNGQYTISASIHYKITWTCEGLCSMPSGELADMAGRADTDQMAVKEAIPVLTGQR